MRALLLIALAAALSGCATHRTHVAHRPDPLHDWASVRAIRPGTPVRATLDDNSVRDGLLDKVTDSSLKIRLMTTVNAGTVTITRPSVVSVAAEAPKKTRWGWLAKPLVVGIVGGLVGTYVGAAMKDEKAAAISLGVFAGCAIGELAHFAYHWDNYEFPVVYVRP